MKTLRLAITALLLLGFSPYIQGQITLSSQAEVDAWDQSITVIEDTVILRGNDIVNVDAFKNLVDISGLLMMDRCNIQDILGLSSLSDISGELFIFGDKVLENLDGLSNIREISGKLNIQSNQALKSINGLENLDGFTGSITLAANRAISDFSALSNHNQLIGSLSIQTCDSLFNLDFFSKLNDIVGSLNVRGNVNLESIDGLSPLQNINGRLSIINNRLVTNIDALSNLTDIKGTLSIQSNENLLNINGLSNIETLTGTIQVNANHTLSNFSGLNNITTIDGQLSLINNDGMISIDNLSSLRYLSGNLIVSHNNNLENIDGLLNLMEILGFIRIQNNDKLTHLNVFSDYSDIKGRLVIDDNDGLTNLNDFANLKELSGTIEVRNNIALQNIDGFLSLSIINGSLLINNNSLLENIDGLSNLIDVTGSLSIFGNSSLTQIDGLSMLNNISGRIDLSTNESLIDISGLSGLSTFNGRLNISNNNSLTNIDGLTNLNVLNGILGIINNDVLVDISGLSSIEEITNGGSIEFRENNSLIDIEGLSGITKLAGNIFITDNDALTSVGVFSYLEEVPRFADIRITGNDALTNLNGFSNVKSVKGRINIIDNTGLNDLEGFQNIESIEAFGIILIANNSSLTNVDQLSNLQKIDRVGRLQIRGNDSLSNIDGLLNIDEIGGNLLLKDNPLLSRCCSLRNIIEKTDHTRFDISNNNTKCDSIPEILDVCSLVINFNQTRPCEGADNGSINIFASDYDTIPFHYDWSSVDSTLNGSGISYQDIFAVNGLPAGSYNVTITLPNGSREVISDIVLDPITGSIFEITQLTTTNSTNGTASGNLFIKYEGGVGPYSLNWNGPNPGSRTGVTDDFFTIFGLGSGEYTVQIIDANNQSKLVSITLLDETVPIFPCSEPLDIIILNDVSGSVDPVEYKESKEFFVDFLKSANIGLDTDKSQATIIEWSGTNEQEIKVQHTGNISKLESYEDATRAFTGGTSPHPAMEFGAEYIEAVGRSDVEKVFVLSTDGTPSQSLISLADQFKARGYHIVTIAFDAAFSLSTVRSILTQTASIPLLAPGARAYSELSTNLADNIVNLYLCPLNPGNSSSVYFYRDASIEISAVESDCPLTGFATVNFDVAAKRELSVPAGTSVMFYHNDPFLFGATPILEYELPCAIPAGSADSHSVILPINSPTKLYAMLNDDGRQNPPFQYPITELEEIAYTNNVDTVSICVGDSATIQALKYTSTPTPICDSVLIYTIDVCNISSLDARGVEIQDLPPPGAKLVTTAVNLNGCATSNGVNYNIPADCCVSLTLTYASNNIPAGFYQAQSVLLDGPGNQIYIAYDGTLSGAEDIAVGSDTENCPSKVIALAAEVNAEAICEDGFLEYTFTIANETSSTIQGATFVADLPTPMNWIFQPYNKRGLSINAMSLSGTRAEFVIDEILADTIASFSLDAYTGDWVSDGIAFVSGMLVDVIDLNNGGLQDLESESVSTSIYSNENSQSRCDSLLTSVEKVIPKSEIIIYPNPTDGTVEIKNVTTPVSYKLISAAGIEYETGIYEDGALELKHEGVNLLVLYSKNQVEIFKVIKLTN